MGGLGDITTAIGAFFGGAWGPANVSATVALTLLVGFVVIKAGSGVYNAFGTSAASL